MPRKKKTEEAEVVDIQKELLEDTSEVVEAPELEGEPAPQDGIALNDLKIGYVVGLSQEGNFVFDLFGTDKGLVELLGIHEHASFRVRRIYEDAQVSGDRLTHEVGKAVALVNQKLDALLQGLRGGAQQRRPDNMVPGGGPAGQQPQVEVVQTPRPAGKAPQQRRKAATKKKS